MLQNMNFYLSEIYPLIYFTGIFACEGDFHWISCPSFSVYPFKYLCTVHRNTNYFQTAKAVCADERAFFDMLGHMGAFFRRLDIYTEVAPNQGMVDTITAIMIEVLNFIGVATKEIKQGRTSKLFLYK